MKAGLLRRLQRLEAASAPRRPPGISPEQRALMMLVAFHRGSWQEDEALAAGWGKALGYELTSTLTHDLKVTPAVVAARHNKVLGDFLAGHGLRLGVSTWEQALPTIAALYEQIPEPLRQRFGLRSVADAFLPP